MKCCDIQAGDLNVPISIEKKTRTSDAMGGATETWAEDPQGTIWAKVQMLTGTERWEAMRVHPGNLLRITLRFRGDSNGAPYWSSTQHRVKIRGRTYGIMAIVDIEMAQRWISMDIFETKPS